MDEAEFRRRTKRLALMVIALVESLPRTRTAEVIGRQLLRSGTSIGANYRGACQARSLREVHAKLGIVEEEADETIYWCELLEEARVASPERTRPVLQETSEIFAMTVASRKTISGRLQAGTNARQPKSEIGN